MNHQDLEPLIIYNKNIKKPTTSKVIKKQQKPILLIKEDDELPKQKLIGSELGKTIQQARTNKKYKQSDVAKYLNLTNNDYQKIENGKSVRNGNILNKLGKYIGVKLTGKNIKY